MRFRIALLLACLATASLTFAQDASPKTSSPARKPHTQKPAAPTPTAVPDAVKARNDVLTDELPNLKSDLAELRAMLNVLASQESGADIRISAALQTNRKMWQIIIYRLAEMTQRLEAAGHPTPPGEEPVKSAPTPQIK